MAGPWFKFYPSDWRADPALRMCSVAARGLWMEMLCIMHEATPRGSFLVNGLPINERQLAGLAGCTLKETVSLLAELEASGVFSRENDGTIYSRRMRRDEENASRDKANGRKGGNPKIKRGVNPPDNHPDKAQIPEPEVSGDDASASKRDLDRMTDELASAGGKALNWTVAGLFVLSVPIGWKQQGCDWQLDILPTIAAVSARAGPSSIASWSYFTRAVTEARDRRTKPLPEIEVRHDNPGSSKPSMLDAADRLIARTDEAAFGGRAGPH